MTWESDYCDVRWIWSSLQNCGVSSLHYLNVPLTPSSVFSLQGYWVISTDWLLLTEMHSLGEGRGWGSLKGFKALSMDSMSSPHWCPLCPPLLQECSVFTSLWAFSFWVQWCAGKCLTSSLGRNLYKSRALMCSICQLPWCKYSQHGQFQAINMGPLNWAGKKWV